jgi:hypothetical protein
MLVSYFKLSLWRFGQLWQYVGIGSLGMRLDQDCNSMGDMAQITPRVPFTCADNATLSQLILQECMAMGDAENISPRVPSTFA